MKRIIKIISIVFVLSILTGCIISRNKLEKTNSNKDFPFATIDDLEVFLNIRGTLNEMNYKYSKEATINNTDAHCTLDYKKNDEILLNIELYSFKDKTVNEVMDNSSLKNMGTKTINDYTWKHYEGNKDGKNVVSYAYRYNGNAYTISFTSSKDVSGYINLFMENVIFK